MIAAYLVVLLAVVVSGAELLHLRLSRQTPARSKESYAAAAQRLRARYGIPISQRSARKRAVADFNTTNIASDVGYYVPVKIGSPPREFNVFLDTGSSDLWVADVSCRSCNISSSASRYDTSKSSTSVASGNDTSFMYGGGFASGPIFQDTVSLGEFTIQNQAFVSANSTLGQLLDTAVSGLMGLAFARIAQTRAIPFWQALNNSGQLSAPEMSFWLSRFSDDPNAAHEEPGGSFTIGGRNPTYFTGDVEFLNLAVTTPSWWALRIFDITVQGNSVPIATGTATLAAIDSGTTLIGGPTKDVKVIWDTVPGATLTTDNSMDGFYEYPCSTQLNITISFGGRSWPINPADLNFGPVKKGSERCFGSIFDIGGSFPGNPNWVIGSTFLKNVYSVFRADPPSVGFAPLSEAAHATRFPPGRNGAILRAIPTTMIMVATFTMYFILA